MRAQVWQLRSQRLVLPRRPLLMGILNVTPDSFSDGGLHFDSQAAIAHGLRLVEQGADLLDIGGESTRPYSEPVSADEELRRVLPVIEELSHKAGVPISIDTSKARVARAALAAGAEIVNDVTGLEGDREMLPLCVERQPGVCAMHMQGTPQTMQNDPQYADVVAEILVYLCQRRDALVEAGLSLDRICLDPGLGFGKTHEHNLELLRNVWRFHALGCPLLIGHSRKGFIGKVIGNKEADRTAGTLGASLGLAVQGAQILRVHDVEATRQAMLLFEAAAGFEPHSF